MTAQSTTYDRFAERRQSPHMRWAVSLVEVLVVISIIIFLLALLVPGLNALREQTRRILCKNNLKQWGSALQMYRQDSNDYLPEEGYYGDGIGKESEGLQLWNGWYNLLPPYLGLPPYKDLDGANVAIKEHPNIHVWICPSKNLTAAFKSHSGKNQFHYGMNQVLDGMGTPQSPSKDTPGFADRDSLECKSGEECRDLPISARQFAKKPHTVYMFDIAENSMRGSPRHVATMYARDTLYGKPMGRFHGDYANFLYVDGGVDNFETADLVENKDLRRGPIRWRHPRLYWGYPPPGREVVVTRDSP